MLFLHLSRKYWKRPAGFERFDRCFESMSPDTFSSADESCSFLSCACLSMSHVLWIHSTLHQMMSGDLHIHKVLGFKENIFIVTERLCDTEDCSNACWKFRSSKYYSFDHINAGLLLLTYLKKIKTALPKRMYLQHNLFHHISLFSKIKVYFQL